VIVGDGGSLELDPSRTPVYLTNEGRLSGGDDLIDAVLAKILFWCGRA
jgi:hypothetical protein